MATDLELKQELVAVSHEFYRRGWSLATSSNFSIRIDSQHFLITVSGKDKGSLTVQDFVAVDLEGKLQHQFSEKPSAESFLHAALYRLNGQTACVLHTHSMYSTILSLRSEAKKELRLQGYEMLKALSDVTTHEHQEVIPIFENSQNISDLANAVGQVLGRYTAAHAFLIVGHGLYTWAESISRAKIQIEALEFMFECEYRKS